MRQIVDTLGVPTVNISSAVDVPDVCSVVNDNAAIGRMAAEHLLERQLKHFAYVVTDPFAWADARERAFAETLAAHQFDYHAYRRQPALVEAPLAVATPADPNRMADGLLTLPTPVGVFAANDARSRLKTALPTVDPD